MLADRDEPIIFHGGAPGTRLEVTFMGQPIRTVRVPDEEIVMPDAPATEEDR